MKYIEAIQKLSKIIPRFEEDMYYNGEYEAIVYTIHLLFDRSIVEVRHDLAVYTRIYREQDTSA